MKKFALFSDILFTFFLSFVATVFFFRYRRLSLPLAVLLAILCGVLTAAAIGALLCARRKNVRLKKSDETQKQKFLLHLALLSDEEKTAYFTKVLSTEESPVKRFGKLRIFSQTEFYFLKFSLSPLSVDEIPNLARLKTGKKKVLLCTQIEEGALALCEKLDIEVKTGEWVYARFKALSALPDTYLGEEKPIKRKRRLKLWFSKRNAKRFLISGGLILLLSRLTPFYYYYLLIGSCLLFAAAFVRIFGYE